MVSLILAIPLIPHIDAILNTWIISLRSMNKGDLLQMSLLPLQEMSMSQYPFPSYPVRILWYSWRCLAHVACISS